MGRHPSRRAGTDLDEWGEITSLFVRWGLRSWNIADVDGVIPIAEVAQQDAWQSATLGVACVSSYPSYAHGLLTKVVEAISSYRLDAEITDFKIELC